MASTNEEQMFLELVNAARLDPLGDATRYISSYAAQARSGVPNIDSALTFFNVDGTLLLQQYNALTPAQPLAWSEQLAAAARAHNGFMIAQDTQDHELPGEPLLVPRIQAQGYTNFSSLGENIFAFTEDPLQGHAGFMVDWGFGTGGMQTPPGHRTSIMSSGFREIGIGVTAESNAGTQVGPLVVTQDFGARFSSGAFILGVAYTDTSGDDFYSLGEGQAGLNVTLSGGGSALTEASGGYTLQTSLTGARTITLTGPMLTGAVTFNTTLAGGMNIKLDIVDGNTLQTSVSGTVGGAVTIVQGLGLTGLALTAGSGAQTLLGTKGGDTLDGGIGADTMIGGAGNDTYVVNSTLDVVTEGSSAGTDLVQSTAVAHTLSANVENLTLLGAGAINGTGNTGNNVLTGNSGNNVLNGGIGADTMIGGAGNDTYVVNSTLDVVTEGSSAGTDLVQSTAVAHTLSANVENLTLLGAGAINGTGNTGNNVLTGNSGNNVLNGGIGADTMIGGAGNDTYVVNSTLDVVTEGSSAGTDLVQSTAVAHTLSANVENLTLLGAGAINGTGNTGNNVLTGNSGNNVLNGGIGADTMIGGAGNDTYVVNSTLDVVTEGSSAGTDLVQSTAVAHTLSANVENLTLLGSANINGTGNTGNNVLTGNSGNNVLAGGAGNDTLIGGAGLDAYLFNSALGGANIDTISGFTVVDDTIRLENAVFTSLVTPVALAAANFRAGAGLTSAAAGDAGLDDYLIYNTSNGQLYYDAGGNTGAASVHFATLTGVVGTVTAADFLVV